MPDTQVAPAEALPAGRFRAEIRASAAGAPAPDDLAQINALAHRELSADEVFCFPGQPSTNQLDCYYTRMAPSSLANYAQDAAAGVALINSHRTSPWYGGVELPLGRTYAGTPVLDETGQAVAMACSAYMLRGYNPNPGRGPSTDEIIRGIEAGTIFDLSIGFDTSRGGWYRCSVCGQDVYSGACSHYPGLYYDDAGQYAAGKQGRLAFAWVEQARLSEVSLVYDGATPGAGILKAQRAVEAGLLERGAIRELEDAYQVRLVGRYQVPDLATIKTTVETVPTTPQEDAVDGELVATIRKAVAEIRVGKKLSAETKATLSAWADSTKGHGEDLAAMASEMADFCGEVESESEAEQNAHSALLTRTNEAVLAAERAHDAGEQAEKRAIAAESRAAVLEAEASDGRAYRADLMHDTLAAGVRAFGERFKQDLWTRTLSPLALSDVKALRDEWDGLARERFGAGGKRQTQPSVDLTSKQQTPRKNTSQYRA